MMKGKVILNYRNLNQTLTQATDYFMHLFLVLLTALKKSSQEPHLTN